MDKIESDGTVKPGLRAALSAPERLDSILRTDRGGRPGCLFTARLPQYSRVTADLDPEFDQQLVVLRQLLAEAVDRSHDMSIAGRHASVLLLQNVCEQSLILGLSKDGVAHSLKDGLEDLYSKLVAALDGDDTWTRTNRWPSVRQLNQARNASHHHGIAPDHQALAAWARDTERFVRSAVQRVFGLDLLEVTLSSLITADDVADKFAEAETELAASRPAAAVRAAVAALDAARAIWRVQHGARAGATRNPSQELVPKKYTDALTALTEAEEVRPFASDMGAWAWVREVATQAGGRGYVPNTDVSREDAARVLSFCFRWIMSWQTFSENFDIGRSRVRRDAAPRRTEHPERGPRICGEEVAAQLETFGQSKILQLNVPLLDPPVRGYKRWIGQLNQTLRDAGLDARIDDAAVATIRFQGWEASSDQLREALQLLEASAVSAAESLTPHLRDVDEWQSVHDEAAEPMIQALRAMRFDGLSVFSRTEVAPFTRAVSDDADVPDHCVRAWFAPELCESVSFATALEVVAHSKLGYWAHDGLWDQEPSTIVRPQVSPEEAVALRVRVS